MNYIKIEELEVNNLLLEFINKEVLPGTNLKPEIFWKNFSKTIYELTPINKTLLKKREDIQNKINDWHKNNSGKELNKTEYIKFLKSISYIVDTRP